MNPYLFTLTFLLLITILTSSEVTRFSQKRLGHQSKEQFQQNRLSSENAHAFALLEDFKADAPIEKDEKKPKKPPSEPAQSSEKKSASLKFNLARPPNNSRLNFYLLLHQEPHQDYPLNPTEVAARLMRNLYGKASFFQGVQGVEYHILNYLKELKHLTEAFVYPDELSTLSFENPVIQNIFFKMLKGAEGCPSLLNYITFDQPRLSSNRTIHELFKINLMFAPAELIYALFENPTVCAKVIALKEKAWEEILDQEKNRLKRSAEEGKNRTIFKKELQEEFEQILAGARYAYKQYKWVFDLSLGKMGDIIFLEDEQTGFVRREKFLKAKKNR